MHRVHFVGAGSGATDLITVRGMNLLKEADVIVYAGSLVNPELLKYAEKNPDIYNSAEMHLDQILHVIEEAFQSGKQVVRLHTGDPSIYGAVREQMDELSRRGIPVDVCPGVSSFTAAAASLRAEFTLPGVSQSVILTRMAGRTPVPERENLRSLAAHGASMAVFLSVSMIRTMQEELLASGGYQEDTPCAVVYKASWPEERQIRTVLSELADAVEREKIVKTAIVLVGDFLGDTYDLSCLYDSEFHTEFR